MQTDNHLNKPHIKDEKSNSYHIKIDNINLKKEKEYQIYYFFDEKHREFARAILYKNNLWIQSLKNKNLTIEIDKNLNLKYCIIDSPADVSLKSSCAKIENLKISCRHLFFAHLAKINTHSIQIESKTFTNCAVVKNSNDVFIKTKNFTNNAIGELAIDGNCKIECEGYLCEGKYFTKDKTILNAQDVLIDGEYSSGDTMVFAKNNLILDKNAKMTITHPVPGFNSKSHLSPNQM